jgi:SAM-dependent MidA family methyltransferase
MPPKASQNPLQALIAERGAVRFRDFMELALYHPEHGYYGAGRAALGRAGDYFTSVNVGPIFGELLGAQFHEMWTHLGRPHGFTIVEQGANDGTLAADILEWSRQCAPDFFEAMRYEIVEGLEVLRGRQQDLLAGQPGSPAFADLPGSANLPIGTRSGRRMPPTRLASKVTWHNALADLPPFTGIHFSNELVDAFPVHRVRFRAGEWRELYVTGELTWTDRPATDPALLASLAAAPRQEGYTTEVNLEALSWAQTVASKIARGWVLAIDYGYPRQRYYSPERHHGTLECYAGHKKGLDPLAGPGFRDLTAHVEFTSLASAFLAAGMTLAGYTDQHHFLTGLVSQAFADRAPSAPEARALKTLLHPEMLGTAFQVLGLARDAPEAPLAGFRFARDGRRELGLA